MNETEYMNKVKTIEYRQELEALAAKLVQKLTESKMKIATAESCTGGMVSAAITAVPGSSEVFDGGVASYANRIKHSIVGVSEETLEKFGAVSVQTAGEMSEGIIDAINADIGVGITGIAGPTGGSEEKPVGTVFISVSKREGEYISTRANHFLFHGDRTCVRLQSAINALEMAYDVIDEKIDTTDLE